ncbi:GNAT family N-acetyltransferase [Paenibacillus sp. JX-17]|uniref:GNAT family N-acetyltransferase n=1 Tax=Paenibacillus lacisoli TaxID=3064525 RepID=A0ABT9CGK4_9BACL|nr:GNAT family N-acetyltransferase [Paenibacillus sp. JX-17]MDO7908403.1 GNAT family N-acetyltransferase [Paenibacillus sp. JX-17]
MIQPLLLIECADVKLCEYRMEDAERITSIAQENEVSKFLPDWSVSLSQRQIWMEHYEIPENQRFKAAVMEGKHPGQLRLRMVIIHKKNDEVIGWCCTGIKEEIGQREIMYAISSRYTNQGYASQATWGLRDYLFNHTSVQQLAALAHVHNVASQRVIQKSGFRYCFTRTLDAHPYYVYTLARSDWNSLHAKNHC